MSAIGTKPTCLVAPHTSAFGGKANIKCQYFGRESQDRAGLACFCALHDEPVAQVKRQNRRDHGRGISHDNRIDHSSSRIP
jgi:hypothetical protein